MAALIEIARCINCTMRLKVTKDEARELIEKILIEWPNLMSQPHEVKRELEKERYRDK